MADPDATAIQRDAAGLHTVLAQPELRALVADLAETRWTGRPGYPISVMVGLALVKSWYTLPTWTRAVRLVAEHEALQRAIECGGCPPSISAAYRFAAKLRRHGDMLDACIDRVLTGLRQAMPGIGETVAIDGSDLPAYANGQRYLFNGGPERKRYSDPDATWGHRSAISTRKGGGYYGYKLHAAVCTTTGLPIAWTVDTAATSELHHVAPVFDLLARRGFGVTTAILDRGYDQTRIYDECESRNIRPTTWAGRVSSTMLTGSVGYGPYLTLAAGAVCLVAAFATHQSRTT